MKFLLLLLRAGAPALLCTLLGAAAGAQANARSYELRQVGIPMRDGVELHTKIFAPLDTDEPCPILLRRTPYGIDEESTSSLLGPSPRFADAGYVFVHQDVRGQFGSGGEWQDMRPLRADPADAAATDECTDTRDTIDWLLTHVTGHNGKVGMWGVSYDGWQVAMAMTDAHPSLLAVSPQASPGDMFLGDDLHHNGAFRLSYSFAWIAFMAARRGSADPAVIGPLLRQEAYPFFRQAGDLGELERRYFGGQVPEWSELLEHGDYDDFWRRRNVVAALDDVRPAVLNVAGWFDAEDFRGPLDIYQAVERDDDERRNFLVVGPWRHGGWSHSSGDSGAFLGDLAFGTPTSELYRAEIEFPFFEQHLRGGPDARLAEVRAFETGGNAWRSFERWPPPGVQPLTLHLREGGVLSGEAPAEDEGGTEFVSDPSDPVPYTARGPVFPAPGYMVEDQRFLDDRTDVLTFVGEPLEEELVLAGPLEVRLCFATTGTDADWIVKLIDVWPEEADAPAASGRDLAGAWTIVSGEIFRAKYRTDFARPQPLVPGELTELVFTLPDRLHRFRAGHALALQVQSTWFPLYDRNPQVFTDIYRATESDFVRATHTVFHRASAPSLVRLPVLAD